LDLIWEHLQGFQPELERQSEYGQAWSRGMQALSKAQESEKLGCYQEALTAFLEAFTQAPEKYEALIGLTYWFVLMGDEPAALHYARQTLALAPQAQEIQDVLGLLESSHRINTLLHDVERLNQNAGFDEQAQGEVLSREESEELVNQTELLLRGHHQLLKIELEQGLFKRLDQVHSRLHSLEALHLLLADHLSFFLNNPQWREQLQNRLDVLAYDLESLENLEAQFDHMHQFQKEVQSLFRELTRRFIRLRIQGVEILAESQVYLLKLEQHYQTLNTRLQGFSPLALREQTASLSGWEHLQHQMEQYRELVRSLSPVD